MERIEWIEERIMSFFQDLIGGGNDYKPYKSPVLPAEPKEAGKKNKKYPRGPAQLFSDEDLRLGVAGKLGKTFA